MIRVGSKEIRPPAPWSVPFAVPRAAVTWGLDAHLGGLAWMWFQKTWQEAGYVIHASGRVEYLAD